MPQSNRRRSSSRSHMPAPQGRSYYSGRRPRTRHRRSRLPLLLLVLVLAGAAFFAWRTFAPSSEPEPDAADTPLSSSPSVSPSDEVSPSPIVQLPKLSEAPWYLTLVNADHPLPEDFSVATSSLSNGKAFDSRAYDALTEMLQACRDEGLEPLVCSAYRSVETQTNLFQEHIDRYMADGMTYDEAYAATAVEVAPPGTSEHSLGLAADICALSNQNLDDSQANTAEQQWLMAHCSEYGFILRYPKDKENVTGIIYEPWHYRYVGLEAAKEITEQGLCLEEYMAINYDFN